MKFPNGVAKRRGVTARDVDPDELRRGIQHELEHTTDRRIAKQIALDHLAETPDYYTRLAALEGKRFSDMSEHMENPDPAATLLGVAIGAVVIFGIAWALKSGDETESAPTPGASACFATYDDIASFANAKGYKVWFVENQQSSTWKSPKPEFLSDSNARAWSNAECNFFRWNATTSTWVADMQTNAELVSFKSGSISGRRLTHHPLAAIMPPLG